MAGTYAISGNYDAVRPVGLRVSSNVFLSDLTTGVTLFRDFAESENTVNESFSIGAGAEGDFQNIDAGTPIGDLIVDHQYLFLFDQLIQNLTLDNDPGSATGTVALEIGPPSGPAPRAVTVPIAAVWTLVCFAALILIGAPVARP